MSNLGRLQKVDPRLVWQREDGDFTPWLANNLDRLAEAIGLDLQLEAQEQWVGPFRADIVARDTLTDSWVLIENQLERTDHSHLGQLITYAAGLDAVTIIWIARNFTEEHRAALDWLNEITDEDINFFGIEIELWQIGDSDIAPNLKMISSPNDWKKALHSIRQSASSEITETGQLYINFWTAFKEYLEETGTFLQPRKPRAQHWYPFAIGRSNFSLPASVSARDGNIAVSIIIEGRFAKAYFRMLEEERDAIEAEIGEVLEWRELPDKKQSNIVLWRRGIDPGSEERWTDYFAWLHQMLERVYEAFAPRIRSLDPEDYVLPENESELE